MYNPNERDPRMVTLKDPSGLLIQETMTEDESRQIFVAEQAQCVKETLQLLRGGYLPCFDPFFESMMSAYMMWSSKGYNDFDSSWYYDPNYEPPKAPDFGFPRFFRNK